MSTPTITNQVLRQLWRAPSWMATNERPKLDCSVAEFDGYHITLSSFRVDSRNDMIRSTYRHVSTDIDMRIASRLGMGAVVDALKSALDHLSRQLFPRPLPTFRIRRDVRRLTSRVVNARPCAAEGALW